MKLKLLLISVLCMTGCARHAEKAQTIQNPTGYVVGHPASPGSGHVGIVDFDGEAIAAGRLNVNRQYGEWLDGTSGYRRYINEEQ